MEKLREMPNAFHLPKSYGTAIPLLQFCKIHSFPYPNSTTIWFKNEGQKAPVGSWVAQGAMKKREWLFYDHRGVGVADEYFADEPGESEAD